VSGDGGGIFNDGSQVVYNSTFSGNYSRNGGGIYGNVIVVNSTFSGNSASTFGGGIFGSATITNCTFLNKAATFNGAACGIFVNNNGNSNIDSSNIFENSGDRGGGIVSSGPLTISNSIISGNSSLGVDGAGGITAVGVNSKLEIINSTIAGNTGGG